MAALVLGGAPAVQAAAMERGEISAEELRKMDSFYAESVQAPHLPWLKAEDCRWAVREDDRLIGWGSYPEIRAEGSAHADVQRALSRRNRAQKERHDAYAAEMERMDDEQKIFGACWEYTVVDRWGRVDDKIISFALRYGYYRNGEHLMYSPVTTENITVEKGEPVAIDAVVTGRDRLLHALAAVFRAKYPQQEEFLFAEDADKALAKYHPRDAWQKTLHWMLNADNDLVVFYNPGDLLPYAAASFELTIRRSEFPEVFRKGFAD